MNGRALLSAAAAVALVARAAVAAPQPEIRTDDVDRFYRVYDAAHGKPSAEDLQAQYLDPGSPGLHQFVTSRIGSAHQLAEAVAKAPAVFDGARRCASALPEVRKRLPAVFDKLAAIYPQASFPPVTLVVGRNTTGGTTTADGVIVGLESICRADWLQPDLADRFVHLIAHEYAHVQQPAAQVDPPPGATLLFQSLLEGGADFVGELTSGEVSNVQLTKWTLGKECAIEHAFQKDASGADVSQWLYNGVGTADKPGDLGYWVGYQVAKAYYLGTPDKKQAVSELLHVTNDNAAAFLARSGWKPGDDCAR